jgi:hypothetical protein
MKKITFIFILAIASALFSCGGSNEKADPKTSQTDTTTAQVSKKTIEKPIINLSLGQAKQRMKAFLKENKQKYKDYGTVEDNYLIGGNYTKDGALDYFYTVNFYPGGDYVYPTHFLYDSEKDAIRELELGKGPNAFQHIVVKRITEGKIFGNAVIWSAFSGEHAASKDVKAEFTIDGNKINVDPKFFPALYNAEKKVIQELEQMESEMMEEIDAYSSDEEI